MPRDGRAMGAMTHRTGGEWVVAALEAEGVRHVFGIPGVHNLAIYDALLRQDRITHILARHEQGAGFMADGYARASGRPGVVVVTTGPGATNALTPLVEAQAGSQPVLLVMSDIPARADRSRRGRAPRGAEPDRVLPAGLPVGRRAARRCGDPRGGPGRLPPLPDRPARAGRALDPDGPPQRAGGGPAHAGWRRATAAVRCRSDRGGGAVPRAGRATPPRRRGRRDRGGGDGGAPGARAPAPRAGHHVRHGAGRDLRDRSALAGRPAEPAGHAGRAGSGRCGARRRLPVLPPLDQGPAPQSRRSGQTRR